MTRSFFGARANFSFFILLFFLAISCHHRIPDYRIRLEISPSVLKAGTVVMGRAFIEGRVLRVKGRAEVLGSPSYKLKKDEACGCWVLKGQVPYGQRIKAGRYRVRVEAEFEDGTKGRAWAEVELR